MKYKKFASQKYIDIIKNCPSFKITVYDNIQLCKLRSNNFSILLQKYIQAEQFIKDTVGMIKNYTPRNKGGIYKNDR